MTKVRVKAGACGFNSVIKVEKIAKMTVRVQIVSACQDLQALNEDMKCIDCSNDVFVRMDRSLIFKLASNKIKHTDCPVPTAIIKGIQIELGGAIAKDVVMTFERIID